MHDVPVSTRTGPEGETPMTTQDELQACRRLASGFGMYVIERPEMRHGKEVVMYLLYRRLRFGSHGTLIGKRNSVSGLWKLINLAKEVK